MKLRRVTEQEAAYYRAKGYFIAYKEEDPSFLIGMYGEVWGYPLIKEYYVFKDEATYNLEKHLYGLE